MLVEASRPYESTEASRQTRNERALYREANSRVERIREVRGSYDDDTFVLQETIHLDQELIERLLHVMLIATGTLATYRVQFIDEDDGRLLLARRSEQVPDTLRSDTDEHFIKLRTDE